MKITESNLRRIIREEVATAKGKSDVQQAIRKVTKSTKALSDLVGKGKVTVNMGDTNITLQAEKPIGSSLKDMLIGPESAEAHDLDAIVDGLKSGISSLDVTVSKKMGKGKPTIIGTVANPFSPKNAGFNLRLISKF